MMLKEEAMAYLDGVNGKSMKQGLEAMTALMERLHWPDQTLKIIHITGTNGKGSTSEFISSMLQAAGYQIGTFNTPYFNSPCECIRISQKPISEKRLLTYMTQIEPHLIALKEEGLLPSGFEILTALALLYFKEEQVDYVILEVGLGGRLDATNIIKQSMVSVFTQIAMDHMNILGSTLTAIATEKAGIIKEKGLVVTTDQPEEVMKVLKTRCAQKKAVLKRLEETAVTAVRVSEEGTCFLYEKQPYKLQMIGEHQSHNCALAIKTLEVLKTAGKLKITKEQMLQGAIDMKWPGRFEKIKEVPAVYIDGAHNLNGIQSLKAVLQSFKPAYTIGLVGILKDKEVDAMLKEIEGMFDEIVITSPHHIRAMSATQLAEKAKRYFKKVTQEEEIEKAVAYSLKRAKEIEEKARIISFGSLYMISDIRRIIKKE